MNERKIIPYLADIQGLLWFVVSLQWKGLGQEALSSALMIVGLIWILVGVWMRVSEIK